MTRGSALSVVRVEVPHRSGSSVTAVLGADTGPSGPWRTLPSVRSVSLWEGIFMLLVLKIPMIYLAAVVLWAIRAEPRRDDGGEGARAFVPLTPCEWGDWRRSRPTRRFGHRPVGPRGRPVRRARARTTA